MAHILHQHHTTIRPASHFTHALHTTCTCACTCRDIAQSQSQTKVFKDLACGQRGGGRAVQCRARARARRPLVSIDRFHSVHVLVRARCARRNFLCRSAAVPRGVRSPGRPAEDPPPPSQYTNPRKHVVTHPEHANQSALAMGHALLRTHPHSVEKSSLPLVAKP